MAFRNIPPNGFPAIPDIEDLEGVEKDVSTLKTTTAELAEDVSDLEEQKANQITIALTFNPESTYEVGDLVYYNGLTYRCTNEHTGEWDADDFSGTTIANELASLKSGLIKSLTTTTTITTGSDGTGNSTPIATLHPGKTILGVIVGYNYQTNYGANHAQNVTYYPPNDYIIIVNDPLVDTEFTVFYTLLYTD